MFAACSGTVPALSASSGLAFGGTGWGRLVGDDAERKQLRRDEVADLVGGQRPAEVLAGQLRDGGRAAGAVDAAGHQVQQRGHLDDLAVGPPHERRRLAVAGVLVFAEQFDSVGQPGRRSGPGRACRGRDGCRALGAHMSCGHGHRSAPPSCAHQGMSGVLGAPGPAGTGAQAGGPPKRPWAALPSPPFGKAQLARTRRGPGRALQHDEEVVAVESGDVANPCLVGVALARRHLGEAEAAAPVVRQQFRVSRLGSSSACSSSRSCIVTAGRVDMNPPSGVICLGRADRAYPRSRVPGSLGPARCPCGAGPEAGVRLSTYILFGYHRTVLFTPGLGKGYGLRPKPISGDG